MATMTVLDASGNPTVIEKPLSPGRAAAASSAPIVLANEDKTVIDAVSTNTAATATKTTESAASLVTLSNQTAAVGTIADGAWGGSGNASLVAALKAAVLKLTDAVTHLVDIKVAAENEDAAATVTADGGNVALGAKVDAEWDGVAGTPSLIAINKRIANAKEQKSIQYYASVATTRPADTTAYTGGDVVGAATAAITFPNMGVSGQTTMIIGASLRVDLSALPAWAGSLRLHLYSATPPSALADNAAWNFASGDRATYRGYIDLGTPVDLVDTCWVHDDLIRKSVRMSGTSLYGYLVTPGGGAAAASTAFTIELYALAV